jgi:WD40-like Beta Propeller Repeat
VALDERLRRELEGAGRPADATGVYEDLIRRHERRRGAKRLKAIALTVGVVAVTVASVVILSKVFEPTRTSPGVDPKPVPVGPLRNGRIAYSLSSTEGMELHTILPDGSGDRVVPTPPGLPWLPAWSPDGSQLAVAIFPIGGGPRAIWVMDADGSNAIKIGSAENVSVPSWSPDGSAIAYSATSDGRTEIRLVSPDGTGERWIHGEGAEGTFAIFSAKFSPDGREILFDRGTDSGFDIFVMDVDGTNVQRLTTTGSDYDPHWSPDGSRIAFTRQGEGAQSDIYVMNADGTNVQQLTDGGEGVTNLYPNWAPDGTAIAYVAGVTGGPGSLVVMNPDGSEPTTLVDGEVLGIGWQPLPTDTVEPTAPATPIPSGKDLGLGFPVCNVSSIDGAFVEPGASSTVFLATRRGDTAGCPQPEEAFNVVALDEDGDGLADSSFGPIECTLDCRAFSAPDVDGDGTDELLVVQDGGAVVGVRLYDIVSNNEVAVGIEPVVVAAPGDPEGGFEPGEQARFLLGGDAFELYTLRCGDVPAPDGPGVVATSAESLPNDAPDAEWHAHQTTLVLRQDAVTATMHVVDVRDFTEPVTDDPAGPSFLSGETLCGANLGP